MSTRSFIGVQNEDETITGIYCHFDGYVKGVGKCLMEHYTQPEKIAALIALGDLSVLGPEVGDKQDFEDSSTHNAEWCLAYFRDRGEDWRQVQPMTSSTEAAYLKRAATNSSEYTYLYKDGEWYYTPMPRFTTRHTPTPATWYKVSEELHVAA